MSNFIKKIKLFNNHITYKSLAFPILAILNILILPFLFSFLDFIPEWKENHLMLIIFFIIIILITMGLFVLIVSNILEYNKAVEIEKVGKIKNWSDKKIRNFIIIIGILGLVVFMMGMTGNFDYTKKSINYIYIQNKEPIMFIDIVIKEDSGGGVGKFVHYAEFQNLEGKYTHMFSGVRFKVGEKYEIKIVPDTKYILESKLLEN